MKSDVFTGTNYWDMVIKTMKMLLAVSTTVILGLGLYMTLTNQASTEIVRERPLVYSGPVYIFIGLLVLLGGLLGIREKRAQQRQQDE